MIKIMFVCHGNICRSPMAEFLFKDMVEKKGESENFYIRSSATSSEEHGCPVHYGTREILDRLNISYKGKRAELLRSADYENYDYFIGMDFANVRNMKRILNGDKDDKVCLLLDFAGENREVADPWWTGDFDKTYDDIILGLKYLYKHIKEQK